MGGEIQLDQTVLQRCRRGDTQAFRVLVEQLMRPAYYHALALTGNPDDALEVSQEAFAKAWTHIRKYDPAQPFYAWYYTILKRQALNTLRTRKRRRETPEDESVQHERLDSISPEKMHERGRNAVLVHAALQHLSMQDREIVCLKDMQGYAYKEIASMLDIPLGTVMSRLYGARQRFRDLMRESGYEHER